jgi:hypothetical protein
MPDNNDNALRVAMARLLAGDAGHTDGQLTITNLAAEASLTRQQAYRSPVIATWRKAIRDRASTPHPDSTQRRIERLTQDLAASQERARRYRLERDEAQAQIQTLANACRALDEENDGLRAALTDAQIISPFPSRAGHNEHRTRPPPG